MGGHLQIATSDGATVELEEAALSSLASRLAGPLLRVGDDGYDAARQIWNGRVERRPALIASCSSATDVAEVVRFAREHRLLFSVRGGGHNVGGTAVCEGGLMLDLSRMKSIQVDAEARRVRVAPGVRWKELDAATQVHALAAPGGQHSEVGVAGFTLGGGAGWLLRKHGLAIDSLRSVQIVTADGRSLRASATEEPDLFWAVRGGGGNFGVVTELELALHPVGPIVFAGLLVHPLARAREALQFFREFGHTAPDDLESVAVLMTGPDGQKGIAFGLCYSGPLDAAPAALAPLLAFGPPSINMVQPMPYVMFQGMLDGLVPAGHRYFNRSRFATELSPRAIDTAVGHFAEAPSAGCTLFFHHLGGAMGRVPAAATAFAHRDAQYCFIAEAGWQGLDADAAHCGWVSRTMSAIEPHTLGAAYINDLGRAADEGAAEISAAYGSNFARLSELKAKYDPTNLFSHNQNIPPAR
ncbi:MAG TPA: FAD-binding oxidoreductase [Polyangiaceae bacterium]|nr:FAD-binding oxidoreductase [Polyangiaceae bacterium]